MSCAGGSVGWRVQAALVASSHELETEAGTPIRHYDAVPNGGLEAGVRARYAAFQLANGDKATAAMAQ